MGMHVDEARRDKEASGVDNASVLDCNRARMPDGVDQPIENEHVGMVRLGVFFAADDRAVPDEHCWRVRLARHDRSSHSWSSR